ncbi:hypothetical protein EYF80_052128 [Liparis tanakae]|uniref:Uncharacterized protein n=1 Tax=Liparis tanakae TaxID=230148 RepID=A0A4Z2F9R2_9TELE|nr:hypothetical protein EYF80_052128 [Liparis tanakae]
MEKVVVWRVWRVWWERGKGISGAGGPHWLDGLTWRRGSRSEEEAHGKKTQKETTEEEHGGRYAKPKAPLLKQQSKLEKLSGVTTRGASQGTERAAGRTALGWWLKERKARGIMGSNKLPRRDGLDMRCL